MEQVKQLTVFLACPGDVSEEAGLVKGVIDEINASAGTRERKVRLDLRHWKSDSYPAVGGDPQSIINSQIADMSDYDLFIGIMWNRCGMPTGRAGSGTEEEFDRAYDSYQKNHRPQIMFYFKQMPSNLATTDELEQKKKVIEFKSRIQKDGLTCDFTTAEEFRDLLRRHIQSWLFTTESTSLAPPKIESDATLSSTDTSKSIDKHSVLTDSGPWIILGPHFLLTDSVTEVGSNRIHLTIPVHRAEEDAAIRSLQPQSNFGRGEPLAFAHQNLAGLVYVKETSRKSSGGQSVWEVTLELERVENDFFSEIALGNTSADEIAEMRARRILLNASPGTTGNKLDDALLESFVSRLRTGTVAQESVLPHLWQSARKDPGVFLPLARLWCVFQLIASQTCQYVLELEIGPIVDEKVHIRFRGQRYKRYTNVDPYIIELEGDCELSS